MILAIVVVASVVALAVAVVMVRRSLTRARVQLDAHLADEHVLMRSKANFYGLRSKGPRQVRGLGILALTADELLFIQLMPEREVRVPRASIASVDVVRDYLGKAQGRDLLKVTWDTDEGAWDVAELIDFRDALSPGWGPAS